MREKAAGGRVRFEGGIVRIQGKKRAGRTRGRSGAKEGNRAWGGSRVRGRVGKERSRGSQWDAVVIDLVEVS